MEKPPAVEKPPRGAEVSATQKPPGPRSWYRAVMDTVAGGHSGRRHGSMTKILGSWVVLVSVSIAWFIYVKAEADTGRLEAMKRRAREDTYAKLAEKRKGKVDEYSYW